MKRRRETQSRKTAKVREKIVEGFLTKSFRADEPDAGTSERELDQQEWEK
jgi:hypothetical protein